jgi:hypothetical protein
VGLIAKAGSIMQDQVPWMVDIRPLVYKWTAMNLGSEQTKDH